MSPGCECHSHSLSGGGDTNILENSVHLLVGGGQVVAQELQANCCQLPLPGLAEGARNERARGREGGTLRWLAGSVPAERVEKAALAALAVAEGASETVGGRARATLRGSILQVDWALVIVG